MATITTTIHIDQARVVCGVLETANGVEGDKQMNTINPDLLVVVAIGIALGFFMTVTRRLQ